MEQTVIKLQLPKPHVNQERILESKSRFRVLLAGRRFGKSLICLIIAINKMLEGKQVAYVTPTHELGRKFFKRILQYIPQSIVSTDNKTDRTIELITMGSLTFFSGENLDAFRGLHFDTCIIDEASIIPALREQWGEAIRPTLVDRKGDAIIIGTPHGKEWFYSQYMKGVNRENGYESFHFTSYDNPTIDASEIDAMKLELTEIQFREEVLAIPGENSSNPFGTEHIRNNIIQTLSNEPTVVYGIDLAKYNDYTVIIGLDANGSMSYFDRFKSTWQLTQNKIESLPSNITKVVDATGVGDVIFENLQYSCQNIQGFKFTSESKPKIIYELIKDVEQGNIKFNEMTADEMLVFEYRYTSTGHISFNAMSGYHDDCIIALAIANHHKQFAIQSANWKLYSA